MKGINAQKNEDDICKSHISFRISNNEKRRLKEFADAAGLNRSAYIKRRILGGRPLVARTDQKMISELLRLGGLLKHNFETLRMAQATREQIKIQEEILQKVGRLIDKISLQVDDSQKNKTSESQ